MKISDILRVLSNIVYNESLARIFSDISCGISCNNSIDKSDFFY